MSGVSGNKAWWMAGTQSAKGSLATIKEVTSSVSGTPRMPFSGGSLALNRQFGKLAETDGSRNQGKSYAKVGGLNGTPETYVRGRSFPYLAYWALGESADKENVGKTGQEHTATCKTSGIPYVTVWSAIMGPETEEQKLFERFENCFANSLQVKTTAGEPLVATTNFLGTSTTRLTGKLAEETQTTTVKELESHYAYNMNDVTKQVKLKGAETRLVSSFDFTLNNGVSVQQTDSFHPQDVVAGIRTVDLTFDILFESIKEYNEFQYGGGEGTTESNKLFEAELEFTFIHEAGKEEIKFTFPTIAYESYPIVPNVTGAPIIASVKGVAQRPASTSESIVTIVTTNQDKKVE